jgi:hypothetical protein
MSNFRGRRLVVVIRAIEIPYRRVNEFVDIHAVQAIDPNCIKFAAQCWTLSPAEGTDSALSAKYVVNVVGLVIDEVRLTSAETKGTRFNNRTPKPGHCAHRAIALEGARAQVKVRLEANGPTMTMPTVCLPHS